MTGRPRAALEILPAYRPGRSAEQVAAEHGIADAVKLASNELPFGPVPSVAGSIAAGIEDLHLYADTRATGLRADIARFHGVDAEQVTVSNGSVTVLQQLVLSYVDAGDELAMCWPSFEAYPLFALLVGAEQVRVPLVDERFDLDALADSITERTRLVFITNPNNPTGTTVSTEEIRRCCARVPSSCIVVLDEAYAEFVTDPSVTDSVPLLAEFDHLVITRTFSKAHGLAGLRVGYALAHPDVITTLDKTFVPFAVNSLAQRAASASLQATEEMASRVASVVTERERVAAALRTQGWALPDAQGNFVWLPLADRAAALGADLERAGVIARTFDGVGVRVTIASRPMNDRFVEAMARLTPG
ncbi:MAG: histidinol-phosphate transaminase [Actinomycetota bacterium]